MMPPITRAMWAIMEAVRDLEKAIVAHEEYEEDLDEADPPMTGGPGGSAPGRQDHPAGGSAPPDSSISR